MKNSFKGKQEVSHLVITILSLVQRNRFQFHTEAIAECLIGVKPELYGFNPFFGKLTEQKFNELCNLVDWLVKHGYLKYDQLKYGKLEITNRGTGFLLAPKPFEMSVFALKKQIPFYLINALREKRKALAAEGGVPVYRIASNHILRLLAIHQPQNLAELFDLDPDFAIWDYPTDWNQLLLCVQERQISAFEQINESMLITQKLYESGLQVSEIAQQRNLSASTILWHLEVLHYHEKIDLTQWIETQLEPKKLQIQASYFKKSTKKKLAEATKFLNISFEEARLSRMYSWHQPVI